MNSPRPETSTPELDALEAAWWDKYADVEQQFCWVQTPEIQNLLRAHYIRKIVSYAGPGTRIAEMGCGEGWLCLQLGARGTTVTGIDFSDAQIRLARASAERAGLADRVRFEVADANRFAGSNEQFDLVIMHGFLHHLSRAEIRTAVAAARRILAATGRLIVFEPVLYPLARLSLRQRLASRVLRLMARVQRLGVARRLRPVTAAEREMRDRIAARVGGVVANGPSPKELPFTPGELPALLAGSFSVESTERVLAGSHHVACESLLLELSLGRLARAIRRPVLKLAARADRVLLGGEHPPGGYWVFEMLVCQTAGGAAELK